MEQLELTEPQEQAEQLELRVIPDPQDLTELKVMLEQLELKVMLEQLELKE